MNESFAELFNESQSQKSMKTGSIIPGTVVEIRQDLVIIDTGLKSEGVIPISQFYDDAGQLEVAIGDQVDVSLDAVEDGFGETKLSREKAKRAAAWAVLQKAHETNETITGLISEKVKGGFTVNVNNIRAFLPGSLVDVRPVRDTTYLEENPIEFKVIKLDQRRNNVVVSRRAVVETENSQEREALLESMQEGMKLRGVVKNLTDYGAFVDLGGVDGLLHITDMAWRRVKHPSDVVSVGDDVDVKVLKFDRERVRVSLGLKQLSEDPWVDIARRYPVNSRLFGKVTNLADYGCFVEIEEGVEGLVHVTEMDWTNKNVHPSKVVQIGDETEVMVLEIDEELRRISLSIRHCHPNPWEEFAATHNKNDKVVGRIKSITDFGIFIGLDGGIDGLVHMSDISWNIPGDEAVRQFKKGDEVEAVVLAVDAERERISLGIKQLEKESFSHYISQYPKGSVVKGVVTEIANNRAIVQLDTEVDGVLRIQELARERVEDINHVLKENQEIQAKIINVDRKKRSISLSIKALVSDEESAVLENYSNSQQENNTAATLGDLIKEQADKQ
ncbi:30S ribosomal protein S1 [Candidatus Marithrix sp. Canyon 246]|uniref:30S ribosomal protein S1 n=1 Tax=Candidatus Marithrix sp. Canyon 246 TaxID=1827136 RepID=UPI00084A0855|nr:30S ribosomal protein S1 [Candidatus Marithrix sp. Canyon 246]